MKIKKLILLYSIVLLGFTGFTCAELINVSVGKTATASSVWEAVTGPENAVDGVAPAGYPDIFHSGYEDRTPWLLVDIGQEYMVKEIVLWNRLDCCQLRLRDITVEILDPAERVAYSVLVNEGDELGSPATITITLDNAVPGQFVRVSRTQDLSLSGDDQYLLQLAELEVFADTEGVSGASGPIPGDGEQRVGTIAAGLDQVEVMLGWNSSMTTDETDPNLLVVNPDLVKHVVYISTPTDPNVFFLTEVPAGSPVEPTAEYGPVTLDREATYYWRVDEVIDPGTGEETITGMVWSFTTDYSSPIIINQPANVAAWSVESAPAAGREVESAIFSIEVENPYTKDDTGMSYEWYKDGVGKVADGQTFTIEEVINSDAGEYYCIVALTGYSMESTQSVNAKLRIKHILGHWPFDEDFDDKVGNYDGDPIGKPLPEIDTVEKIHGAGSVKFTLGGTKAQAVKISSNGVPAHSSLTISFWERTPEGPDDGYMFASGDAEGGTIGYEYIYIWRRAADCHYLGFYVGRDFIYHYAWELFGFPRDQWHLCTFVYDYDLNRWYYYVDGVIEADYYQMTYPMEDFVDDFFVGNREDMKRPFPGNIDDLQIFDFAMSRLDVAQLYVDVMKQHDPDVSICFEDVEFDLNDDCEISVLDVIVMVNDWMACNLYPVEACD